MNKSPRDQSVEDNNMTFRGDFLRFNIGHVVTIVATAISLAWQASQFRERVSLLEQRHAADFATLTASSSANRSEFHSSITAQQDSIAEIRAELRVGLDGALKSMRDVADTSKDFYALQGKLIDSRLVSLEQGARDNREIISQIASLQVKVENVRDAVADLRRNQPLTSAVAK